jgi:hypothetical protein
MAAHAPRLARLFSPTFARAVNAQIVYPATSQVVKPNGLESALAKPLHKAHYQPESSAAELAATLSYGIIKGRLTRKKYNSSCKPLIIACRGQYTHFWMATKELVHLNCFRFMILQLTGLFLAFFLANEYVRAQGLPGVADGGKVGEVYRDVHELAERYIGVASGQLDADALLTAKHTDG